MIEKIWRFLSSTRLAIFFLILLTFVSVVGIAIPQDLEPEQYAHQLGAFFGGVIVRLSLDHMFSATWFYCLLGMLSINITACIITRLWKNVARSMTFGFLSSRDEIEALKQHFTFNTKKDAATVLGHAETVLRDHSFRLRTSPDGLQISAKKGSLKEIGSMIFHFSIIILFIGGLVGRFNGYSFLKELRNGETATVPERSFIVRSDSFNLNLNEQGEVKDYETWLSLLDSNGAVIVKKMIQVNDPLTYQGIRFYQTSYGKESGSLTAVRVRISGLAVDSTVIEETVPFGTPVLLPKTEGVMLTASQYIGDFIYDTETKQPMARSSSDDNPALLVVITQKGDTLHNQWSFLRYPDVHMGKSPYAVAFLDYSANTRYYTGIQIRHNPGVPLVWVGILFMTAGIIAMFYVSRKSVWVVIRPDSLGGSVVSIGGMADQVSSRFQEEFLGLSALIQTTSEGGS